MGDMDHWTYIYTTAKHSQSGFALLVPGSQIGGYGQSQGVAIDNVPDFNILEHVLHLDAPDLIVILAL
jgi:hypothetical protein